MIIILLNKERTMKSNDYKLLMKQLNSKYFILTKKAENIVLKEVFNDDPRNSNICAEELVSYIFALIRYNLSKVIYNKEISKSKLYYKKDITLLYDSLYLYLNRRREINILTYSIYKFLLINIIYIDNQRLDINNEEHINLFNQKVNVAINKIRLHMIFTLNIDIHHLEFSFM